MGKSAKKVLSVQDVQHADTAPPASGPELTIVDGGKRGRGAPKGPRGPRVVHPEPKPVPSGLHPMLYVFEGLPTDAKARASRIQTLKLAAKRAGEKGGYFEIVTRVDVVYVARSAEALTAVPKIQRGRHGLDMFALFEE